MVKTAIVTGASRGIGRAIAEKFASLKYNVALISRHFNEVERVARDFREKYSIDILPFECDISDKNQVKKVFAEIHRKSKNIEVLVNNAGINSRQTLASSENWFEDFENRLAGWENEININLTGTYICSYIAAKYMINRKSGSIVNISSIKGKEPTSSPGYGASKAGVEKLTKDFAKALASYGIRVNCVSPGFINCGMTSKLPEDKQEKYKSQIPLGRFGEPKEIADAVVFLSSDKADYITGQVLGVNGGYLMG